MSDNVLNFSSLHPGVPGYCVYMDNKIVPLDRDLGCFNRDPGQAGRPGLHINTTAKIIVNYQQAQISVYQDILVYRDHINRS